MLSVNPQGSDTSRGSLTVATPKNNDREVSYLGEFNLQSRPFIFGKNKMSIIDPRTGINIISTFKLVHEGKTYYSKRWFLFNAWAGVVIGMILGWIIRGGL